MAKDPKALAFLLGAKKDETEPDADEPGDGADDGEGAAADGIIAAVQAGDAKALAAELRNFVELCTAKSYPEE